MNPLSVHAVVLAAGRSKRFKTTKSKLLFSICGRPMVLYPIKALASLNIPVTVVLGNQAEQVKTAIEQKKDAASVDYVIQEEQRGTGHALACSQPMWDGKDILIINGDCPLISSDLIAQTIKEHTEKNATITFLTALMIDPSGYGRVYEEEGAVRIIEEKDCSSEELRISRINVGVYIMRRDFLEKNIGAIQASNAARELYLVDLVKMASDQNLTVHTISVPFDEVRGVNTLQELWSVEQIKRSELIRHWMSEGVQFELAQNTHIDIDVTIGAGSFIGTSILLLGNTTIGKNCFVGAFSILENTTLGDNSVIHSHTVVQDSTIGSDCNVGPFARLRNNVTTGNNVTIGNFVEIKKSTINEESSIKHLSYIGDTTMGKEVNVGAGTITCNYDGTKKHQTVICDNAFVGSNNTIIAPVTIGQGAFTAAGSTITHDVPANSLAIARSQQVNKAAYAEKLLAKKK
ncbi:MAG: bifunctional UDP-N-acetylglucosamine diphosphorylase/glucosamine-1-phosphate N-acetyltransferase GlmU [Candidatus Babeliales bacterium]